jgi:XTP/dITP diphosphohydrolase
MQNRTLLIATTNAGKLVEIREKFKSLHINTISLDDLEISIAPPDEYGRTIEENALIKAVYYGEASGYATLADDGGLFIDELNGWPGVHSARVADTAEERITEVLTRMNGKTNRNATFRVCTALYDPIDKSTHITYGDTPLQIADTAMTGHSQSWGYNPILLVPEIGKTYAQMSVQEKNQFSHRSKALSNMQYHLKHTYSNKTIVCACSIIVRDNRILLILRNDPHRPEYHRKWEFPGGSLDFGESVRDNVIREAKEETGYDIEPVHLLQYIPAESQSFPTYAYQIILPLYICKIVGGEQSLADEEALDAVWVPIDEVLNYDMVGENARFYETVLPELKKFLQDNPL